MLMFASVGIFFSKCLQVLETLHYICFAKDYKRNFREKTKMGEILRNMTVQQWCEISGVSPDTVRMAFPKIGLENFAKNRELSKVEISRLENHPFRGRKTETKQPAESFAPVVVIPAEKPAKEKPAPAPAKKQISLPRFDVVKLLYNTLAPVIVVGHGFLIWQEAAALYGWLGQIAGCLVFLVVLLALLYASDSRLVRTSEAALWFMALVDLSAIRVHYETLQRPDVPFPITVGFCIFIAASSWTALYLYRDSKIV